MSGKSQKILKTAAVIILSVVAVVFMILFFTGRVGDFIGVTSDTSSSSPSQSSVQSVASITEQSSSSTAQSTSSTKQSTSSTKQSTSSSSPTSVSSSQTSVQSSSSSESAPTVLTEYKFRSKSLLEQHYQKHGRNMGFKSAEEYEKAASAVPNNPAALHKTEKEDGDDVYYIESTNEFVVVSTDGYIRTYFNPDRGIDYFNKQ